MAGVAGTALRGGCLAAAAVLLAGCGSSGGGGAATTTAKPGPDRSGKRTTVLMMRHCARSMPENGIYDDANLSYFNNYSSKEWPAFDVPDFYCLARGEQVVEQQGQWYKAHGDIPFPVQVVADDVERDIHTGQSLLKGLGVEINDQSFSKNKGPFDSAEGTDACPKFTTDEMKAAIDDQLRNHPQREDFEKLRQELYGIAGAGKAGDWTKSPCTVVPDTEGHWWAPLTGSCSVASNFAERFLMESAGAMDMGWGSVKAEDVPRFLNLHTWYLQVALFAPALQKRRAASIAWAILEALEEHTPGTKVFAGHDTNQGGLNGVLGLSWDPSPWPLNSTMPGSALRFDREDDGDTVTMSYVFVGDFTKGGDMKSVPASVSGFSQGTISLKAMRALVEKNTMDGCRTDKKEVGFVV